MSWIEVANNALTVLLAVIVLAFLYLMTRN
jgi:hypothetical protein